MRKMNIHHKIIFPSRSRLLLVAFFAFLFTFCIALPSFAQTCGNSICEPTETLLNCMSDCKDTKWAVNHKYVDWGFNPNDFTQSQFDFINKYFASIEVAVNSQAIRDAITTELNLYRLINGVREDRFIYNLSHINSHENMFLHCDGSPFPKKRIITRFGSWLTNGYDFVDPSSPDAQDHWINYWATTVAGEINKYGYDTLRIDSATHKLFKWWTMSNSFPEGCWPLVGPFSSEINEYSDETYAKARYDALNYTKSLLPNKKVVWNGMPTASFTLPTLNSTIPSLEVTDGGMAESFVYKGEDGAYQGYAIWKGYIDVIEEYKDRKLIFLLTTVSPEWTAQQRQMAIGSYLLVKNHNVRWRAGNEEDVKIEPTKEKLKSIQEKLVYFAPEYTINIGESLGNYSMQGDLFRRDFQNGFVLVNPYEDKIYSYTLDKEYQSVEGQGACLVQPDGSIIGCSLAYTPTSGKITLPPASAIILVDGNPADVNEDGNVNIKDIQICIKGIIDQNSIPDEQLQKCQAVALPDTVVNIKDIQGIVQKIINP